MQYCLLILSRGQHIKKNNSRCDRGLENVQRFRSKETTKFYVNKSYVFNINLASVVCLFLYVKHGIICIIALVPSKPVPRGNNAINKQPFIGQSLLSKHML